MPAKRSGQNEQHAPRLDIEEVLQSFRDIDRKIEAAADDPKPNAGMNGEVSSPYRPGGLFLSSCHRVTGIMKPASEPPFAAPR